MSVSAASNVSSVLDGFWLIILFILGHVFLSVCTSGYLWWHARHRCEFHLAECCIPISLVEFCSGIQLDYLELIFRSCFYALVGRVRAVSRLGLFILHYFQGVLYPMSPELQCSPSVLVGTGTVLSYMCSIWHCSSHPPGWASPTPWAVSLHSHTEAFCWALGRASCGFLESSQDNSLLSGPLSCRFYLPWCSLTLHSVPMTPKKSLSGSTSFPPLCAVTGALL